MNTNHNALAQALGLHPKTSQLALVPQPSAPKSGFVGSVLLLLFDSGCLQKYAPKPYSNQASLKSSTRDGSCVVVGTAALDCSNYLLSNDRCSDTNHNTGSRKPKARC